MGSFQKVRVASALLRHFCHMVSLLVSLLQAPMCIGVGFGKPCSVLARRVTLTVRLGEMNQVIAPLGKKMVCRRLIPDHLEAYVALIPWRPIPFDWGLLLIRNDVVTLQQWWSPVICSEDKIFG
jgi:hypothetical protein